jgi:hypothetical protein
MSSIKIEPVWRLERRKGSCATQGEKAAIIKALREKGYSLKYLLRAMSLPKSTYYFEINKEDVVAKRNVELMNAIESIFIENKRRYGVRRVHKELIRRGYKVNHKRVQRLMHHSNLLGKRPKEKYRSYKGKVGKTADNIINRDFSANKPLQKWTTDVSQFNFSWGKCYLSPILDMATKFIHTGLFFYHFSPFISSRSQSSTSPKSRCCIDGKARISRRPPKTFGVMMRARRR